MNLFLVGRILKDEIEQMVDRQTRMGKPGRPKVEEVRGVYLLDY